AMLREEWDISQKNVVFNDKRFGCVYSLKASLCGVLQADAYGGYRALYESGRITEAACMAHARRKIHDVHARAPTYITTE
ncbi:transposase, partial [Escherichia coli]|uniref:IS66 family transposase n=1 Tax=Escherichia coli TaxID=562 RepID=UPI00289B6968